jgi:hypothetical protein
MCFYRVSIFVFFAVETIFFISQLNARTHTSHPGGGCLCSSPRHVVYYYYFLYQAVLPDDNIA